MWERLSLYIPVSQSEKKRPADLSTSGPLLSSTAYPTFFISLANMSLMSDW